VPRLFCARIAFLQLTVLLYGCTDFATLGFIPGMNNGVKTCSAVREEGLNELKQVVRDARR
jgi:hypothetical protein